MKSVVTAFKANLFLKIFAKNIRFFRYKRVLHRAKTVWRQLSLHQLRGKLQVRMQRKLSRFDTRWNELPARFELQED